MRFGAPEITFAYHLGVHSTDEDLLVRSLLVDEHALAEQKILVPRPRTYRKQLRHLMLKYKENPIPDAEQKTIFDKIVRGIDVKRVVFSHDDFLGLPENALADQWLYSNASSRGAQIRNIFPENPCEFFLAIRNPVTYLQQMLRSGKAADYQKLTRGANPREMFWVDVIEELRNRNQDCQITVWCDEDTPLIWSTVLRRILDVDRSFPLKGEFERARLLVQPDKLEQLQALLKGLGNPTENELHEVIASFLDEFSNKEALEESIEMPYWTPELIKDITNQYSKDIEDIQKLQGVNLILA